VASILEFIKARLGAEPPLRPVESRMARRWVKERLKVAYPELGADPKGLEEAYRSLGLEPRAGMGEGGETLYEVIIPGGGR